MSETLEELETQIAQVESDLAMLRGKIESAIGKKNATGEYADPQWFARIRSKLRNTGALHQNLLRKAAAIRREQRQAETPNYPR